MKRKGLYKILKREELEILKRIVSKSRNIVFFGGAGVSTASGIPDFRSKNGIYRKKSYGRKDNESMLTHRYYEENKEAFLEKYRNSLHSTEKFPNPAHIALKELEDQGKLKAIITQNVDGLHQKAGSTNIIELHGNHGRQYCENCGKKYDTSWYLKEEGIRHCDKCGGIVRPEMVFFGEPLDQNQIEAAKKAVEQADTFIIGGSSLAVYPAAGLLRHYKGEQMIFINEEPTKKDKSMDYVIYDDISKILPKII
ncbi:MAG: NAD-dependent protein deacylase [Gallicola sp.]|nr:NAD-dependent protein deacylase [Gallicola sp.]